MRCVEAAEGAQQRLLASTEAVPADAAWVPGAQGEQSGVGKKEDAVVLTPTTKLPAAHTVTAGPVTWMVPGCTSSPLGLMYEL